MWPRGLSQTEPKLYSRQAVCLTAHSLSSLGGETIEHCCNVISNSPVTPTNEEKALAGNFAAKMRAAVLLTNSGRDNLSLSFHRWPVFKFHFVRSDREYPFRGEKLPTSHLPFAISHDVCSCNPQSSVVYCPVALAVDRQIELIFSSALSWSHINGT